MSMKQNCCWNNFKKNFCFQDAGIFVFSICYLGVQERKHLGNTEESSTRNVCKMFPRLCIHETYVEDVELVPHFLLPSRLLTHATL